MKNAKDSVSTDTLHPREFFNRIFFYPLHCNLYIHPYEPEVLIAQHSYFIVHVELRGSKNHIEFGRLYLCSRSPEVIRTLHPITNLGGRRLLSFSERLAYLYNTSLNICLLFIPKGQSQTIGRKHF